MDSKMMTSEVIIRPAIAGAAAAAASYGILKGKTVDLKGIGKVPVPVAIGGAVFVGGLVAEIAFKYLYPENAESRLKKPMNEITFLALVMAAEYLVLSMLSPGSVGGGGWSYGSLALDATIAVVASDYIYDNFVADYLSGASGGY